MEDKISPEMIGVLILEEIKGMRKDMREELQQFKAEVKLELKSLRLQFYDYMQFDRNFPEQDDPEQLFEESLIEELVGMKKDEPFNETLCKEIESNHIDEPRSPDKNVLFSDVRNENTLMPDNGNLVDMFEQKQEGPTIDVVVVKVDRETSDFKPGRKSNRLHNKDYLARLYKEYHMIDRKSGFKGIMDPKVYAEKHCPHCKKFVPKKSALIRHIRTHTGEKPFKCEICDHCFTRKEHLKSHKLIHSGDKPFKCTICSNAYRYQRSLKVHINSAHNP